MMSDRLYADMLTVFLLISIAFNYVLHIRHNLLVFFISFLKMNLRRAHVRETSLRWNMKTYEEFIMKEHLGRSFEKYIENNDTNRQ